VNPDFVLTQQNSGFEYFNYVVAGPYLSAAEKFGSPAYSEDQLESAPEVAREGADRVLAAALPVRYVPLSALPPAGGTAPGLIDGVAVQSPLQPPGCITVRPNARGYSILDLPPGGALLDAPKGVSADLRLRRFASASFPIHVATLRGAARLDIPRDRSGRPWELQVGATGKVTVCGQ
jgi:hypothetical protein